MKFLPIKPFLALCAALFSMHAPVMAASSEELTDIRDRLHALMERVDRLEQQNEALRAQNQALQAANADVKPGTAGARDEPPAQKPQTDGETVSWTERVAFGGDLRYRHEQISDDTRDESGASNADRYRDRIRARLNAQIHATETIDLGIGIATAEGGDPRSSNQTLGDVFSRKGVYLDLAYFDWSFADWGHLIGGKMKQPFFKPGENLFWDGDINPEGLAVTFERDLLFGSVYSYWLDEVSGPQTERTSDTMLFGGQIGARVPIGESNLVLAAQYYDLSAGQGRAPFYNGNSNGNSTVQAGTPPTSVLLYDYRVLDLMAEFNAGWNAPWGTVPLQIWAAVAQNQDPDDLNTAWAAGAGFGEAADRDTWELGAAYHSVEKDALFAQLIDADLGGGLTDASGWVLRAGYAPMKNVTLNVVYFINERNVDVANAFGQTDVDYDRLQLDLNMEF